MNSGTEQRLATLTATRALGHDGFGQMQTEGEKDDAEAFRKGYRNSTGDSGWTCDKGLAEKV